MITSRLLAQIILLLTLLAGLPIVTGSGWAAGSLFVSPNGSDQSDCHESRMFMQLESKKAQ